METGTGRSDRRIEPPTALLWLAAVCMFAFAQKTPPPPNADGGAEPPAAETPPEATAAIPVSTGEQPGNGAPEGAKAGPAVSAYLEEYKILSAETLRRLESQQQAFNFLIAVLAGTAGAVAALLNSGKGDLLPKVALFIPIVTGPLGFIFFDNELMIMAIGAYIRNKLCTQLRSVVEDCNVLAIHDDHFSGLGKWTRDTHAALSYGRWLLFMVPSILPLIYAYMTDLWLLHPFSILFWLDTFIVLMLTVAVIAAVFQQEDWRNRKKERTIVSDLRNFGVSVRLWLGKHSSSTQRRLAAGIIIVVGALYFHYSLSLQKYERGAFLHEVSRGHVSNVASLLSYVPDTLELRDPDGNTPLMTAAGRLDLPMVELILEHQPDVTAVNKRQETALMCAVESTKGELVHALMDRGADVSRKDLEALSADECRASVVEAILQLRSNQQTELRERTGSTALIIAVKQNQAAVAEKLIDAGADVNACDHQGRTPLMWAAARGLPAMVTLLCENGAITARQDGGQDTALSLAKRCPRARARQEMLQALGGVHPRSSAGRGGE